MTLDFHLIKKEKNCPDEVNKGYNYFVTFENSFSKIVKFFRESFFF